jgi:hypothetical protein
MSALCTKLVATGAAVSGRGAPEPVLIVPGTRVGCAVGGAVLMTTLPLSVTGTAALTWLIWAGPGASAGAGAGVASGRALVTVAAAAKLWPAGLTSGSVATTGTGLTAGTSSM